MLLKGEPWYPAWPERGENWSCEWFSDKMDGIWPPLPERPVEVELEYVDGRSPDRVYIIE